MTIVLTGEILRERQKQKMEFSCRVSMRPANARVFSLSGRRWQSSHLSLTLLFSCFTSCSHSEFTCCRFDQHRNVWSNRNVLKLFKWRNFENFKIIKFQFFKKIRTQMVQFSSQVSLSPVVRLNDSLQWQVSLVVITYVNEMTYVAVVFFFFSFK